MLFFIRRYSVNDIFSIDKMRQNLADTMNSLPNQSPRKKTPVETEEIELLSESRRLAGACKAMIRSVCGGEDEEHWGPLVNEVVESAERVTNITETLVRKSNAIFHAQLMTANTDQMLRCLKETVESMRKLNGFDPSEDNSKILVSHSTSLSAAITQILHTVRGL
ncbi:hypothetical protein AB6A40_009502 [Gnathostoma spinigerum]|uniref:Uncharacterized protein n=1 Tax=Gnathostoma spinigerum TaxID=75299 RepID=A0ABD6ES63_9BILA